MIQGLTFLADTERTSHDVDDRTVVLMATFNGAAFLDEQLRSLREQTDSNWILVARDDHSTDETIDLLNTFAATCEPRQIMRMPSGSKRLGVLDNFLTLLAHAPISARYAFCDQDDVWLPNKLMRAAKAFRGYPNHMPVLYCSRQVIVDETLGKLGLSSDVPRPPSLSNALVQNIATGNTVVINEAARRAILATPAPANSYHDWWCYLVVAAVGGAVVFDRRPSILYRQHGRNVVGSRLDIWTRFASFKRRGFAPFVNLFFSHSRALLEHPQLTMEADTLLRGVVSLPNGSALRKMRLLNALKLYRQAHLENVALKLWFVLWCIGKNRNRGAIQGELSA
jgi:glycosyltransferase involved in cell wall biosynthesis